MAQEARNKLRRMGGIMASSPELMQAAQGYQDGGPIMMQPPAVPRVSGYAPGLLPTGTVDPSLGYSARNAPISPTQARRNRALELGVESLRMDGPMSFGGGAQYRPTAPEMPFDRRVPAGPESGQPERMDARVMRGVEAGEGNIGDDAGITVDDLLNDSVSRVGSLTEPTPETSVSAGEAGAPGGVSGPPKTQSGAPRNRRRDESEAFRTSVYDSAKKVAKDFYEGPVSDIAGFAQQGFGLGLDALGGAASVLGMDSVSSDLEQQSDRLYNQAASNIRQGASATTELDPAMFDMEPEEFRRVISAAQAAEDARQEAASAVDRRMSGDAAASQSQLEELLPPNALDPKNVRKAADIVNKELAKDGPASDTDTNTDTDTDTDTGGGSDGPPPPPPEPTKKDLRSRYKEKIELFKEIYGEDDEERARDRAMSLAMMGLAIASGQSPDALTNIAQGAAAGLQGMSEQERARREQEQGLQTLALESALGEMDAERASTEAQLDRQNRLDAATLGSGGGERSRAEYRYNEVFKQTYESLVNPELESGRTPVPPQQAIKQAQQAAQAAAPSAPSAQQAPSVTPVMSPEEAEAEAKKLLE